MVEGRQSLLRGVAHSEWCRGPVDNGIPETHMIPGRYQGWSFSAFVADTHVASGVIVAELAQVC